MHDTHASPSLTSTEHALEAAIRSGTIILDDLMQLATHLRLEMRPMEDVQRKEVIDRLRARANDLRAQGLITDSVLFERVARSLERFFHH